MFHPHFFHLFFDNRDAISDTMALVSAYKVEQDLQRAWREERERRELKSDSEQASECSGDKQGPFRG